MKRILIFGAGRSSKTLIHYLAERSEEQDWVLRIVDIKFEEKVNNHCVEYVLNDVQDASVRDDEVKNADLVISMLPSRFHQYVIQSCLKFSKNMLTASYEIPELLTFKKEIKEKGILILNECGLDPGLDHMSAMRILNRIKNDGHNILSFESFTGGLVASESDNNPWNYKFSWNPRNVVLAGQGGSARFIQNGKIKYIPYNRLFRRTDLIKIEDYGFFEGYANRDSLSYIDKYNLQGIPTIFRGTLRRPGFSKAWNVFVQLGATDDTYHMENTENMTYREFINSFLPYHPSDSVELKLFHYLNIPQDSEIVYKLNWLGIFSNTKIGLKKATPAQVLEQILKDKWKLQHGEKDMIVMWHKIIYTNTNNKKRTKLTSSLVVTGDGNSQTAMSKTVGLPLAVAAKLILLGKIKLSGIFIPNIEEIYLPVITELKELGIEFKEQLSTKEIKDS